MTTIYSGYDLSNLTYSPEGRLLQMEYAAKLVSKSSPVVGLVCKDGLVILSQRFSSNSIYQSGHIGNCQINKNIFIGATGYTGDIDFIMQKINSDNKNYLKFFSNTLASTVIVHKICSFLHVHTLYWHLRPLACSFMIGSIDHNLFELFIIFLSGFFVKCFAGTIGICSYSIQSKLEFLVHKKLCCRKSIEIITFMMKKILANENKGLLEIAWLCKENSFKHFSINHNLCNEYSRIHQILS
nr:26S proteasome SU alpha7 [Cryptomonas paramecium]